MLKFLDFDGVIVDSIKECYVVSKGIYFGYLAFLHDEDRYKALFYKYRGLVRPAYEYMALHDAINIFIQSNNGNIRELFELALIKRSDKDKDFFEKEFFYKRHLYQNDDFLGWIAMNPLMPFGNQLRGTCDDNVYIVTTKNKESTMVLLDYDKIQVAGIYSNDDIKKFGNKGALIKSVMDEKNVKDAIFVDDAVEHLDTVQDKRVLCFFADWGYGENSNYNIYKF